MSNRARRKLLLLLADPDISDEEFQDVARWLSTSEARAAIQSIWRLRRQLDHDLPSRRPPRMEVHPVFMMQSEEEKVYEEIERLLIIEGGLSVKDALRLLSNAAGFDDLFDPRTSFRRGIERLYNETGGSVLLSLAHQLRNRMASSRGQPDWPLMGGIDVEHKKPNK